MNLAGPVMNEITFIVAVHGQDAGYTTRAGGPDQDHPIIARGKHRDELIQNIHKALAAAPIDATPDSCVIHLHFVRDPA
jgi:hypothetical protein